MLMKRLVLPLLVLGVFNVVVKGSGGSEGQCTYKQGLNPRPHSVTITEFGAVGDGETLNSVAFQNAVFYLRSFADKGGAQLYVPKGEWLTGSFNLTSHLTLFLEKGAVIIGTQESSQWPIVDPLPSYGQGIDLPGGRHRSLINGHNLTDVVITGNNGVIDGQGSIWWEWFRSRKLNYSRPHLVEFTDSQDIVISNLSFLNSPAWSIHPVYCSNVIVQNITIQTSPDSPFTDGIVPDSSSNMCIEDCSISVGHDAIALKSGWDGYGISYARPTTEIQITKVALQSAAGAALAFGSEMSGGISDVRAEQLYIYNSSTGVSFRTTLGRGGFVEKTVISNSVLENVREAIRFDGHSGGHPDDHYDPSEIPIIRKITLKSIVGSNISVAGNFSGIENDPFTALCLSDLNFTVNSDPSSSWSCSDVSGYSELVFPKPCSQLQSPSTNSSTCFALDDHYNALAVA
ncbi:probable polygalacturonase isoform X1 [Ananas comosus]|uniref:Probable polygalacturonase isoform X1 n=1 Tax=Ananas comosus TaxID=4615 RepID=A0A6P5G7S7_ANACO|nr:probable polygalacturonase isoform X1 [Ananas comosus]